METHINNFLKSFFGIFDATLDKCRIHDNIVFGNIRWNDDHESQDFSWKNNVEKSDLIKSTLLCEYLTDNKLMHMDKIMISKSELEKRLVESGWSFSDAQDSIDDLLSLELRMVDDGIETDSFFVHF